jgi:S1-C subfamily serine protease
MVRRYLLVMSAVMLAAGSCAPDPGFLKESAIQDVRAPNSAPVAVKAKPVSFEQSTPASVQQVMLPAWRVATGARPGPAAGHPLSPTSLFERVSPSVYGVKATQEGDTKAPASYGSAVAISPTEAVTNCHVVNQGRRIILSNAKAALPAEVIAADPRSDRCYLKVTGGMLEPVRGMRDFASLSVGETVYTIGSPRGLDRSLGQGLLSGLRRMDGIEYVQITAPVSEGSSGGGLFDEHGNLIGVTTFTVRDSQSLNFAIAASEFWNDM